MAQPPSDPGHAPAEPSLDDKTTTTVFGPWSWLLLLSRCTYITLSLLLSAIKSAPPSRRAGLSFHEHVAYQGMRAYQSGLGAVQVQHLLPPTAKTCRRWAKRHSLRYHEVHLPDGTLALWLGPRDPQKVRVLFHGGGYMAPALWQHMDMAFGFSERPRDDDDDDGGVAVVVLQYALASEQANRYPTQLRQAAHLLRHLIRSEGVPPSSITLLGDSAGGHLLLGLLLHVNHPHPSVPPVAVEGLLAGAALISPWVEPGGGSTTTTTTTTTTASLRSEKRGVAGRDVITPEGLAYWAGNLLGGAEKDPWNSPLSAAPGEWWGDLPVEEVLVTYGREELFADDVARLGEVLGAAHPRAKVVGCEGELHVHMVMNRFLRINKPCRSEREFVAWLKGLGGT
ncbi:alpha/beta-hydrolase [Coniochaeta sp. PMI_546]|nr:alpha/beta-hydrolase [Coniochaeta sp. PMI_546]